MECPQCKGYKLEPKEIETGLVAGSCPKCSGVLIPLMNYRYWIDQGIKVKIETSDIVTEDNNKAKQCPKCSRLMTKFAIGSDAENKIELCNNCDEAWLDKGEWQLLKLLDVHNKLPLIFTDAWQRNIRLKQQEKSLKTTMKIYWDWKTFKSWINLSNG